MKEFILLVQKLRTAQKDYFKYRDNRALRLSMQLEKEVDKKLTEFESDGTIKKLDIISQAQLHFNEHLAR